MTNKKLRFYTYIGAVFMAAYTSLPGYINSSFLTTFIPEDYIGWLYALASIVTVALMVITPKLINRWGNRQVLLWLTVLSLVSIVPLAGPIFSYTPNIYLTLTAFALYVILGYLTRYTLDVYLENISDDKGTGLIRGIYMTFYNLAWLVSPFAAAYLVTTSSYNLVYAVAGVILIPLLLITIFKLKETGCDHCISLKSSVWLSLKNIWKRRIPEADNIRRILIIDFLLNLFYALMVVYMPLYLHNHIGLSWGEIGLAFTVMLVPFVLFELPLGKVADKWLGEKEILISGIIIITISTAACAYLIAPDWILWAGLLFVTRTGASTIEIMKETYLFKKISGQDTGVVALSRINVPLSYLVGPVFVSLILMYCDFRYIFLGLSLTMLVGLKYAWELVDTK